MDPIWRCPIIIFMIMKYKILTNKKKLFLILDIKINDLESEFINELTIPEESFCISHNRRGVISLSNAGKNSNGPQFIISLKPNSWMDYYYVAFG